MQLDIAVDIETTGTTPTSGIWEVGVVAWKKGTDPDKSLVTIRRDMKSTDPVDPVTIEWMKEEALIYERYLLAQKASGHASLILRKFFDEVNDMLLDEYGYSGLMKSADWYSWGQFDFPILHHHLHRYGVEVPWHYRKINCWRSVMNECATGDWIGARPMGGHNALEDAKSLAKLIYDFRNSSTSWLPPKVVVE